MRSLQSELSRVFGCDPILPMPRPPVQPIPPVYRDRATSYAGDPVPETDEALPPQRYFRERGHRQWAQHSVDQNRFYHRKRHAKRGDARQLWVGPAMELSKQQDPSSFKRGKGLKRDSRCKYSLYVEGLCKGYLDDINEALAWAKAATYVGLQAQCVEE
jgi:hypothetical protein